MINRFAEKQEKEGDATDNDSKASDNESNDSINSVSDTDHNLELPGGCETPECKHGINA
jgi:hypothetical protein